MVHGGTQQVAGRYSLLLLVLVLLLLLLLLVLPTALTGITCCSCN